MGKTGKFVSGILVAAALGTVAAVPSKIPFLLTANKMKDRIERLDKEAGQIDEKIKGIITKGVPKSVKVSHKYEASPEGRDVVVEWEAHCETNAEKKKVTEIMRQKEEEFDAEMRDIKVEATELCHDTVTSGRINGFEFPFEHDTYEMPDNIKKVCGTDMVTFNALLPINIWRVILGVFAAINLIGAVGALFKKEKPEPERKKPKTEN